MATSTDEIRRSIHIEAPRSRVWRAVSNAKEFGTWFHVNFDDQMFEPGKQARGSILEKGYEHVTMEVTVEEVSPEHRFSFRWHPGPPDPGKDFSAEPTTLVVFELQEVDGGTDLTITESGFDELPIERREAAFRGNDSGWKAQLGNIQRYVTGG